MKEHRSNPLPYLAVLAVLGACAALASHGEHAAPPTARKDVPPPPTVAETVPSEATPAVPAPSAPRRVVLVSVDGLSGALVASQTTATDDAPAQDVMPNLKRMFAEGAGTFKALVPQGHTTAISHAALFTGADPSVNGVVCEPDEGVCSRLPMEKGRGFHSVTFRWTPLKVKDTLFTVIESAGFKAVAAVQKGKLVGMFRPDGDETGILSTEDARKVVATGCDAVQDERVRLAVLHFKMIDDAGHHERTDGGWLSERQFKQASIIDRQLQQVRECVDRANKAGGVQTILIVTSDHGGTPGHDGGHCGRKFDNDETWLVPWVAVGPGIRAGHELAGRPDLHPARGGVTQPSILLIDTVPTILDLLGIPETSIPTLSKDARPVGDLFDRP